MEEIAKRIKEDALWSSPRRRVWELAITEVFNHFVEQIPGEPPAVCKTSLNSLYGGRTRRNPDEMEEPEQGMTVPDLSWYYDGADEWLYRTGGANYRRPFNYRILLRGMIHGRERKLLDRNLKKSHSGKSIRTRIRNRPMGGIA